MDSILTYLYVAGILRAQRRLMSERGLSEKDALYEIIKVANTNGESSIVRIATYLYESLN